MQIKVKCGKTLLLNSASAALALVGVLLLIASFQTFAVLKSIANSLLPDHNFNSLTQSNIIVFKIYLVATGLVLLVLAYFIRFQWQRLKRVRLFIRQFVKDFYLFQQAIKLEKSEKVYSLILLLITGLAVIFRLMYIYVPMRHDEAYTLVAFASDSLFDTIIAYHLPNNHVFHSILVNIATHVLGIQPWTVRLPAFVAGVLMLPASYLLAKNIYDKETALASALLVAYSPALVSYSTNARGYTLETLITLLILILGVYVRKERNLFAWVLLVCLATIGFYTIPIMLFPFGILFTWLFLSNIIEGPGLYASRMVFFKYWAIAGICTAILVLILYTPIFIYTGTENFFANGVIAPLSWPVFSATLQSRLVETWYEWQHGIPPALILLLGLGFGLGLILHRRISSQRVPLQLAALIWIGTLLIIQRPNAWARIWLFLLPLVFIWSTAGIIGLLKALPLKLPAGFSLATIVVGAAILLVAIMAIRSLPSLPEQWTAKGEAESAVLFLKDKLQDQDLIIVTSPDDAPVWYYSRLYGIADAHFDNTQPFSRAFIIVNPTERQTLDSVFQDRGPSLPPSDIENARLIQVFGRLELYVYDSR
jgi:hypothetical protein